MNEPGVSLRAHYLLDPDVIFLNHGSFGATPRPVFAACQRWERELEREPVRFIERELPGLMQAAREALGAYVGAGSEDLVFVPNATFGANVVARSLALGPGDEVLMTDHEYGACENVWAFLSRKRGFTVVRQHVDLPAEAAEPMIDGLWHGVTERTRVIFCSQITSPTAITLPVEELCARARAAGILTVIDGAHAPGQIPLQLAASGPDFYFANAHKWLSAPKGAAFLYARRDRQALIEPLVVGWGWGEHRQKTVGSDFLDAFEWLGTNDLAAYLAVPAAIRFQQENQWEVISGQCHALLREAIERITALTALPDVYGHHRRYHQMAVAELPHMDDLPAFKNALYDAFCVQVPCTQWNRRQFIRISIQAYNTLEEVDALLDALEQLLPRHVTA
jgi:isopenicillin-N epimerase